MLFRVLRLILTWSCEAEYCTTTPTLFLCWRLRASSGDSPCSTSTCLRQILTPAAKLWSSRTSRPSSRPLSISPLKKSLLLFLF